MRIASLGVKLALLLLIGVVLAQGCGPVRGDFSDLVVTVKVNKGAYGWGEVVGITVSAKNNGTSTLNLIFGSTELAGFEVYKAVHGPTGALELVSTTVNNLYADMMLETTMAPGETWNFTYFSWGQTSETDVEVLPATYWIVGYFKQPWPSQRTWSQPVSFEIRGYGYVEK